MGRRNKPFIPIVNNDRKPVFKDKNDGCLTFILLGIIVVVLAVLAALGYGIYWIVTNPKETVAIICCIAIILVGWGIIALIFNGMSRLFKKGG